MLLPVGPTDGAGTVITARLEDSVKAVTDTSKVYEAERRVHHVKRPGFRITEMQISRT